MDNTNKRMRQNTRFIINPCLEFACAIRWIGEEHKLLSYAKEMNYKIEPKDEQLINKIKANMSRYVKQELEYFYNIAPICTYPVAFIADNQEIQTVDELLKKMEQADLTVVFKYLGGIFIYEYAQGLNGEWSKVIDSLDKMYNYIEKTVICTNEKKQQLLECFRNPEETKLRLCFMFKQFYEKAYAPFEKEILDMLAIEKEKYTSIFNANPEIFYKNYILDFSKKTKGIWNFKIDIHVSILYQIQFWVLNLHDYIKNRGIIILGARNDKYNNNLLIKDEVEKFLKVLADKRRVDIIKLLAEKICYGYEIANILKLTPATVNYHMTFIMDAGLITLERENNKVLYKLDKEKVKLLFRQAERIILKE